MDIGSLFGTALKVMGSIFFSKLLALFEWNLFLTIKITFEPYYDLDEIGNSCIIVNIFQPFV